MHRILAVTHILRQLLHRVQRGIELHGLVDHIRGKEGIEPVAEGGFVIEPLFHLREKRARLGGVGFH